MFGVDIVEKSYFKRVLSMCSKGELIYWWILRALMIGGIVYRLINIDPKLGYYQPLQMSANLVGMFAFEICQMFPKKTYPRLFPSYFQNFTIIGFFLASFGGAFLNFYYLIPAYDKILHAYGCVEATIIGYELITAMQIRDKKTCPANIAALAAFGFAFIMANGWELFEFVYDQWFGGDAQHWNYYRALEEAAENNQKLFWLIPLDNFSEEDRILRFAIMDTMGDMILNVIGAVPTYIALRIRPYHHMGKNNVNKMIEEELAKTAKETVNV